jgi:hypothetical protein
MFDFDMRLDSPMIVSLVVREAFEIELTAGNRLELAVVVVEMAESPFDWRPESHRRVVHRMAMSWALDRSRPGRNWAHCQTATGPVRNRYFEVEHLEMVTGLLRRSLTDYRTYSLDLALVLLIYLNPFFLFLNSLLIFFSFFLYY